MGPGLELDHTRFGGRIVARAAPGKPGVAFLIGGKQTALAVKREPDDETDTGADDLAALPVGRDFEDGAALAVAVVVGLAVGVEESSVAGPAPVSLGFGHGSEATGFRFRSRRSPRCGGGVRSALGRLSAMNPLPIVVREMRCAARRPTTYWGRCLVAAAGLAAWVLILLAGPARVSAKGALLLSVVGSVALGLCLLSGVFLTSDSVSEEKREGTLGLLFLTDLKGRDVVLGKLVPASATAFFALCSLWPILSLPLLTGGTTWGETLRLMGVLLVSLLMSLSVGMLISTFCVEARTAFVATLSVMVLIAGVPMLLWVVRNEWLRTAPDWGIFHLSPFYALMHSFDRTYHAGRYLGSFCWTGGVALACLALANWRIPRAWQAGQSNDTRPTRGPSDAPCGGAGRGSVSRTCAPGDAYFRVALRQPPGVGLSVLMLVVCGAALLLHGLSIMEAQPMIFVAGACVLILAHLTLKIVMAFDATRQIHEDARGGGLELVLSTPLSEADVVRGQLRAFGERWWPWLVRVALVTIVVWVTMAVFYTELEMDGDVVAMFSTLFLGGLVALYADYRALGSLGIWKALRHRTHLRATAALAAPVLGIPWIVGPILFAYFVGIRGDEGAFMGLAILWFGSAALLDLFLVKWSMARLAHLRRIVAGEPLEDWFVLDVPPT